MSKFGEKPRRYLTHIRMKEARRLLEREKKVPIEVSTLVGYANFRSFRAQFINTFGIPPSS